MQNMVEIIQKYFITETNLASNFATNQIIPFVEIHPVLRNVIIINHLYVREENIERFSKEIIVDTECAAAVLRGANIYAPGIVGMMSGIC